jgi:hypothetical protein
MTVLDIHFSGGEQLRVQEEDLTGFLARGNEVTGWVRTTDRDGRKVAINLTNVTYLAEPIDVEQTLPNSEFHLRDWDGEPNRSG